MIRYLLATIFFAGLLTGNSYGQFEKAPGSPGAATRPVEINRDPKPVHRYEVKKELGEYLVLVKVFRGTGAQDLKTLELAEDFVEHIRTKEKVYAYIHERGWAQRQAQEREVQRLLEYRRQLFIKDGIDPTPELMTSVKRQIRVPARVPDEFVVYVAQQHPMKDFETANTFAKTVRGFKMPPKEFCDNLVVSGGNGRRERAESEMVNPFGMAFAARNPLLVSGDQNNLQQPVKADDFVMKLNAGEDYSLLHQTKKKYTLVVQMYGADGKITNDSAVSSGDATDALERAALQAREITRILRMGEYKYPAFVMHTKYASFVCVGDYDDKDDPQLIAHRKALQGLKLIDSKVKDQKLQVMAELYKYPATMEIPRP